MSYTIRNRDTRQVGAAVEGTIPDTGNAIRNRDARQASAVTEGTFPNTGDTISNRDARQASAATEGTIPDTGNAIRNCDARQASAATEGASPDTGDRISFNGVRNHQFTSGGFIAIANGDFATVRGVCQVAKVCSVERQECAGKERKKGIDRLFHISYLFKASLRFFKGFC